MWWKRKDFFILEQISRWLIKLISMCVSVLLRQYKYASKRKGNDSKQEEEMKDCEREKKLSRRLFQLERMIATNLFLIVSNPLSFSLSFSKSPSLQRSEMDSTQGCDPPCLLMNDSSYDSWIFLAIVFNLSLLVSPSLVTECRDLISMV